MVIGLYLVLGNVYFRQFLLIGFKMNYPDNLIFLRVFGIGVIVLYLNNMVNLVIINYT